MKIHQIRNATLLVEYEDIRLLVDPMLANKHALPPLRFFKMRGRNPSVPLPENADLLLNSATHCLITHCQKGHFDHLDGAAKKWLIARGLPVFCTPRDAPFLQKEGLNVRPLQRNDHVAQPFLGGTIQTTPCIHGHGLIGRFMEHGVGYFIAMPSEPTLFLTGDTLLTDNVRKIAQTQSPDVIVAPAGGARFDLGDEIIMNADDICSLAQLTKGTVIANHLEAISHCPVSRNDILVAARAAELVGRIIAPRDGEAVIFEKHITGEDLKLHHHSSIAQRSAISSS